MIKESDAHERALAAAGWAIKDKLAEMLGAKPLLGDKASGDWVADVGSGSIDCSDLVEPSIKAYLAALLSDPATVEAIAKAVKDDMQHKGEWYEDNDIDCLSPAQAALSTLKKLAGV